MLHKKLLCVVFSILFMFNIFIFSVSALSISNYGEIQILGEAKLPEKFNLKINAACLEHKFFLQSTVQEDGTFAIYTRGRTDGRRWYDLDTNYIDIYDKNGNFITEIEFETTLDVTIEINDSVVNAYLYSEIIRYDILTEEIEYLLMTNDAANENGIIKKLRAKEFSVGEWDFSYEDCFEGYNKLIRSKDDVSEVILELDGTSTGFLNPTTIVSFLLFCLWLGYILVKRKGRKTRGRKNPGVGSMIDEE